MKIQEAKKIITEYMEFKDFTEEELTFNPCSLDALVPVWEKLGVKEIKLLDANYEAVGWFADLDDRVDRRMYSKDPSRTITEAAAISTAKAIEALK